MALKKHLSRWRREATEMVRRALAAACAWAEGSLPSHTTLKVVILIVGVAATSSAAFGNTIIVGTTLDEDLSTAGDGNCSLRKAIDNANAEGDVTSGDCVAGSGNDTINFDVFNLTVSSTLPTIENTLTIDGQGQDVVINGGGIVGFNVFAIDSSATVVMNDLTIENEDAEEEALGQGIVNKGKLTVTDCTIQFTTESGIANSGTLNVSDSTFYNNSTAGSGGAIANNSGVVSVINSTFVDNGAVNGGAIYNGQKQKTVVTNSTFSDNSGNGASIFNDTAGVLEVGETIMVGAPASSNECNWLAGSPVSDLGYNLSDDATCNLENSDDTPGANGQQLGDDQDDPLDPSGLQLNGTLGLTETVALKPGSPVIDAIPISSGFCPSTDQRGFPRPDPGDTGTPACDVGAYESQPTPTPTATPRPTAKPTSTPSSKPSGTPSPKPTATPTAKPTSTATTKPTSTPSSPSPTATPTPLAPFISGLPSVILAGGSFTISGLDFTAGSVVNFFVATSGGPVNFGPLTPSAHTPTQLTVPVPRPPTISLGQGFVDMQVVNKDQGFVASNLEGALLQGDSAAGVPSLTSINGTALAATSSDPSYATDNVQTVVVQGTLVTLGGSAFDTTNGVAVDLFCACTGGKVGPFFINSGPELTSTSISLTLPSSGPNTPVTGPGSFVVSNAGADHLYAVKSNAVSVPIGARISVTSVTQTVHGGTITVNGTGFSPLTVINFFNTQGGVAVNLGGIGAGGTPKIPLTFVNSTQFTFSPPAGAISGQSYVQALNAPFVPFSSSGNDPGGAFTLK